jgi:serine/threonine protein kinase
MRPRQQITLDDGRYEIGPGDFVGEGHFGEVYRAQDTHQNVQVAVKLFQADVEFDQVLLEAQMQTQLSEHARVVSIRNVIVEPPRPFVVMDYFPSGSVHQRLEAGNVTPVEAIRWTRDALAGLAHGHALGIVHRDVKPGNWLLGPNDRVSISDFGVAEDTVRNVTVDDQVYWRHMAPEVPVLGSSPASDVWATGCTLYRLVTGAYPFETFVAARTGGYEAPHHINRQIPMSLTRVIENALKVERDERYADAPTMLAALNGCRVMWSWRQVADPAAIDVWVATTDRYDYRIELRERPRVGLELRALRDTRGGAGLRARRTERPPSLARARQQLRNWLVAVVEGGDL